MKMLPILLSLLMISSLEVLTGAGDETQQQKSNQSNSPQGSAAEKPKSTGAEGTQQETKASLDALKKTALSEQDLKTIADQHLFWGKVRSDYSPSGLYYELHNPFRDKIICAITVSISNPQSKDTTTLDVLIVTDCAPLTRTGGSEPIYNVAQFGNNAVVELKGVYYTQ